MMRGDLGYECLSRPRTSPNGAATGDGGVTRSSAVETANRFPAEFADLPEHATLEALLAHARRATRGDIPGRACVQIELGRLGSAR